MTFKQALYALEEQGEDAKFRAKIAGCEVEESKDKVATLQDLLGFGM